MSTRNRLCSGLAVAGEAEAGEPEHHHRPGRSLGNAHHFRSYCDVGERMVAIDVPARDAEIVPGPGVEGLRDAIDAVERTEQSEATVNAAGAAVI